MDAVQAMKDSELRKTPLENTNNYNAVVYTLYTYVCNSNKICLSVNLSTSDCK